LTSVPGGYDVALDRFHCLVGWHSSGHHTLEEIPFGPITVIAADPQDDCSFLLHRLIAFRKKEDAGTGQASGLGIALVDGEGMLTVAGAHISHEGAAAGNLKVAVDAVLHVQPRVGAAWVAVTHDVDGVHVSGLVVEIIRLGITEVKAALAIEIEGGGDHVDALGLTMDCCAFRAVVAVAHARRDGDAVDLVSGHGRRQSVGPPGGAGVRSLWLGDWS
jgi:hypothetical protein